MNIRELPSHHDLLIANLEAIEHKFSVIVLTETWLTESNYHLYEIEDYNSFHCIRDSKHRRPGGGVSIYVHHSLKVKTREDLKFNCKYTIAESNFIEIEQINGKNIIIGGIYKRRSGTNNEVETFVNQIERSIDIVNKEKKTCYIAGDFNLNLLHYDSKASVAQFLDAMFSYDMTPAILSPTRFESKKPSLIDQIFLNYPSDNHTSGNLLVSISDHLAQFVMSSSTDSSNKTDNNQPLPAHTKRIINEGSIKKLMNYYKEKIGNF